VAPIKTRDGRLEPISSLYLNGGADAAPFVFSALF
jgi:hypothetical protein